MFKTATAPKAAVEPEKLSLQDLESKLHVSEKGVRKPSTRRDELIELDLLLQFHVPHQDAIQMLQ